MTRVNKQAHTNHLIDENSPYLLSHAHNPVDWYPWGPAALQKAKDEDKPIFLSIGYAACHWCHVMERESFENEQIAQMLNRDFVSIKVDREQRPDIDQIYMSFTTAMTGGGGWPMSVFLTPALKPFFAGTYFPPVDGYGRPSFGRVLQETARAWQEDKTKVLESSQAVYSQVTQRLQPAPAGDSIPTNLLKRAAEDLLRNSDPVHGGIGDAPKFPHALELSLWLRHYRRSDEAKFAEAAHLALRNMARGGIYDQLGGGFARYSTDSKWLVPHFEKMLYDNALLVPVYVEAFQINQDSVYSRIVRETLDWILAEMVADEGGIYSTLDADSEGEEGKFYVWTESEIQSVLDSETATFAIEYFNTTSNGNWEETNILHLSDQSDKLAGTMSAEQFAGQFQKARHTLLAARAERPRPLTDDKILTSWNGLALTALCRGFQIVPDQRYLQAAVNNATFVESELYRDGRLTHAYREGRHSEGEFLEDYAYYTRGLIDLYQSDFSANNERWLDLAVKLAEIAIARFQDSDGRWYLRPDGQSDLIYRPHDENDGAVPAPGSIMTSNLLKLHRLTGNQNYLDKAERGLSALSGQLERYPPGMASAVLALDFLISDKIEVVVVGKGEMQTRMLDAVHRRYLPNRIVATSSRGESSLPLFEGRTGRGGVVAYVCRNSVCSLPAHSVTELEEQLAKL